MLHNSGIIHGSSVEQMCHFTNCRRPLGFVRILDYLIFIQFRWARLTYGNIPATKGTRKEIAYSISAGVDIHVCFSWSFVILSEQTIKSACPRMSAQMGSRLI